MLRQQVALLADWLACFAFQVKLSQTRQQQLQQQEQTGQMQQPAGRSAAWQQRTVAAWASRLTLCP
jgi:hypothetical protein